MRVVRAGLAAIILIVALAPVAAAQGLQLITAYPSVVADPGGTAEFEVTVLTDTAERVDLTVTQQPEGWTTRLRGAGSTISAVTTAPDPEANNQIQATFTAEVDVPAEVGAGSNQVIIEGRSAGGLTTTLTLDITIEAEQPGSVSMTTDFPTLTGAATDDFSFSLTLRNDTNQQVTFGLETEAPPGWVVTARPASEDQAAQAIVDAGDEATINVEATAPNDAPAQEYGILVRAVGGPEPVEALLGVTITGNYAMTLSTDDGRLNARVQAGGSSTLNLVVQNTGTAPLTNVAMTATPPRNWQVSFDLETIPVIEPGAPQRVVMTITPTSNAVAGDYVLTVSADATEAGATEEVDIRTTVETSPVGYLIGIAILVIAAVGLFFVFQRYGRR
jgi:uncharacterized membrane protein